LIFYQSANMAQGKTSSEAKPEGEVEEEVDGSKLFTDGHSIGKYYVETEMGDLEETNCFKNCVGMICGQQSK